MAWRMEYSDFYGNRYGEVLDAHERVFNFNLQSPNTASFRLELVNPLVSQFLTNKEGLIFIYRNRKLAMTAELTAIEVTGDESDHSFTVVATETMYPRLLNRMVGQSSQGLQGPINPQDQGLWLMLQLEALNAINPTGLRDGVITPSGNISGGAWRYKPWMELAQELAATINGFDMYQRPRDPAAAGNGGVTTGAIDIASVIGNNRPNVVFDYGGMAANARAYQWLIHNADIINKGAVLPPSFPDSGGLKVATASDAASQSLRGLREQTISSDLSDFIMRQQLAQLHVALRKQPREQFIIQPGNADGSKRVPQFLTDYNIGDTVRGRVQDQGILMLDALVRVYGVTATLTDEGMETIDLNVINDGIQTAS